MEATKTTERVTCNWCGGAIRRGTRPRWWRLTNGDRIPLHGTCAHRYDYLGRCFCDICTGDIH